MRACPRRGHGRCARLADLGVRREVSEEDGRVVVAITYTWRRRV
ncbi:MAG TPA: hypothetical protein VJ870_08530 [Amycolatopsis sp.]|nr:hypothetical protein [Amycolatopsis sp.]